jgi:nitroimidazol reductase NimA-like FMN-containing flavoprotein (pyridoxamine 5'-phosphate oxidase superfamily)
MLETTEELAELQQLLDRSFDARGAHARAIVVPERRLSAAQTVAYLQDVKHVTLATVTAQGEPFAAPLDGWFLHGRFVVSTSGDSVRSKHIAHRPAVSLTHVVGDEVAFWVHGRAERLPSDHPWAQDFDRLATGAYGSSPYSWSADIAVFATHPRVMFAYASDPTTFGAA